MLECLQQYLRVNKTRIYEQNGYSSDSKRIFINISRGMRGMQRCKKQKTWIEEGVQAPTLCRLEGGGAGVTVHSSHTGEHIPHSNWVIIQV